MLKCALSALGFLGGEENIISPPKKPKTLKGHPSIYSLLTTSPEPETFELIRGRPL